MYVVCVYMRMYVCMYVCLYVSMYACTFVYTNTLDCEWSVITI